MCNCLIDEGRPLGTGWQEQVPNHLRRLWSKALVVSTEGKGLGRTRSGDWQEEDPRKPLMKCRKRRDDVETAGSRYCGISFGGACLRTEAASGIKVA